MPYKDIEKQKAAQQRYYLEYKDRIVESNRERRNKIRQQIRDYKEGKPCSDCDVKYPYYIMDFDHVGDDKVKNISRLAADAPNWERILVEIEKCELVCANCHRHRTHMRATNAA